MTKLNVRFNRIVLLASASVLTVLQAGNPSVNALPAELVLRAKRVASANVPNGTFSYYVPKQPREVLVLVHGYPWRDGSRTMEQLRDHTSDYVARWRAFAEKHGLILIAPAFGSGDFEGFRALFGRRVDADEFVIELVDLFTQRYLDGGESRFSLYGHSAGAQFAGRFLVVHPQRVKTVVISAPSTYPIPNPAFRWPYGMRATTRREQTSGGPATGKDPAKSAGAAYEPDQQGWVDALEQTSIRVIVGTADLDRRTPIAGQPGMTRVARAEDWMAAMQALAEKHNIDPDLRLVKVDGIAHDPVALTPASQRLLMAE